MGIKLIRALPYSPQTGGRFEAFGKRLKSILRGVLAGKPHLKIDAAISKAVNIYMYATAI